MYRDSFPPSKWGSQSGLGHINHFYRIDDRDDEFSRSSDFIIESDTENLQFNLHCLDLRDIQGDQKKVGKSKLL